MRPIFYPETFDTIIRGGTVVNHDGRGIADIGIRGGKIAAIGDLSTFDAGQTLNAKGLHVLPGVIDTQVHFREPGPTHKENLEAGSRGAVLGGVTGVFEMPNTNPTTSTAQMLEDKLRRANGRMHCNHAFYVGGTHANADHLGDLERLPGCCGVKVFMGASTGDLLIADDEGVSRVLASIRRRASFHSEDEFRLEERRKLARKGDWTSHTDVRDKKTALLSTQRLIGLARQANKRIHILHISTAEELPILAANKDLVTCEVLPNHLSIIGPEAYEIQKGRVQQNPPIRDAKNAAMLWEGVRQGIFDILATDHAPHTLEEKAMPYPASPSGMPGVQTLVPIMLDWVNKGALTLERFVDLVCHGPNRVWGIAGKGRLCVGYDADITIVDLKKTRELRDEDQANISGWTPYHGKTVTGWPTHTIIDGQIIMAEDEVVLEGQGKPYRFSESM
ncbi:dihydroorotase [Robiginitomaculum antarcticum]|uniref:dihydroorotase n=1 Tax=Robiginitomaculum antarcticum TaxID=437507 RepID=UPI00037B2FC6|nr:dihydroorotase [Robiginitomaculum antarcticum]